MGVFGDLSYASTRPRDAGAPVEAVRATNQSLSAAYTESRDKLDAIDIAIAQLDLEAGDDPVRQRIIADIKAKTKQFGINGNYEYAQSTARSIAKDVQVDPELNAAIKKRQIGISNAAKIDAKYAAGEYGIEQSNYEKGKLDIYRNTPVSQQQIEGSDKYNVDYNLGNRVKAQDIPKKLAEYATGAGLDGYANIKSGFQVGSEFYVAGSPKANELIANGSKTEYDLQYRTAMGNELTAGDLKKFITGISNNDPELKAYVDDLALIRNEENGLTEADAFNEDGSVNRKYATGENILAAIINPTSDKFAQDAMSLSLTGGKGGGGYSRASQNKTYDASNKQEHISKQFANAHALIATEDLKTLTSRNDVNDIPPPGLNKDELKHFNNPKEIKQQLAVAEYKLKGLLGLGKEEEAQVELERIGELGKTLYNVIDKVAKHNRKIESNDLIYINDQAKTNPAIQRQVGNSIQAIMDAVPNKSVNGEGEATLATDDINNPFNEVSDEYTSLALQQYENIIGAIEPSQLNRDGTLKDSQYNELLKVLYKNKSDNFSTIAFNYEIYDEALRDATSKGLFGDKSGTGDHASISGGNFGDYEYVYYDKKGGVHEGSFDEMAKELSNDKLQNGIFKDRQKILNTGIVTGNISSPTGTGSTGYKGNFRIDNNIHEFQTTSTTKARDDHFRPIETLSMPTFDGKLNQSPNTTIRLPVVGANGKRGNAEINVVSRGRDVYDANGGYTRVTEVFEVTEVSTADGPKLEYSLMKHVNGQPLTINFINSVYRFTDNDQNAYNTKGINDFGSYIRDRKLTAQEINSSLFTDPNAI